MKDILVKFGLPAILMTGCICLLAFGIDGEVKAILTMSAVWLFRSSYQTVKSNKVK